MTTIHIDYVPLYERDAAFTCGICEQPTRVRHFVAQMVDLDRNLIHVCDRCALGETEGIVRTLDRMARYHEQRAIELGRHAACEYQLRTPLPDDYVQKMLGEAE